MCVRHVDFGFRLTSTHTHTHTHNSLHFAKIFHIAAATNLYMTIRRYFDILSNTLRESLCWKSRKTRRIKKSAYGHVCVRSRSSVARTAARGTAVREWKAHVRARKRHRTVRDTITIMQTARAPSGRRRRIRSCDRRVYIYCCYYYYYVYRRVCARRGMN